MRITTVPVSLLVLFKNQLKFVSRHFEVVAVSAGGKMLDQLAEETKVKTIPVNMTRKITPLTDLRALINLVKIMLAEKPYIVHTHTPKAGLLGMIAARLAGVPVRMHTVAGLPLLERKGILRHFLNVTEKITYACATKVYPNSARMLEIIVESNFCGRNKLQVIGKGSSNGVDTDYFNPELYDEEANANLRAQLNIDEDDFIYCFIGRMVSDKGVNELVDAFLHVNKLHPKTKLILVGPFEKELDPLNINIERQIHSEPSIKWVDYQPDVRPYLAVTNVFVFPSYREGFPNVLMQAGSMGVPCIATDINGCNEIIQDHINGMIIPAKSRLALVKTMKLLYEDSKLLAKMAACTRDIIKENFESSYVMNELLNEYHHQLGVFESADLSLKLQDNE